jgi:hypothetical protein
MTNWTSVTDILERLHNLGVPAAEAIEICQELILIGKAAERAARAELRLKVDREAKQQENKLKTVGAIRSA